ncbi:MAG: tRNA preQ1(34) S-adenosylmethionine ribosyltransferase-isomerase QueA [Bacteroidales bacterium]|nr:tRNA preQ1(34) S-adenosylmethionine ribosyltransferase-isomerase QueA [Candidatus Colicola caccequi]MCQ2328300.1 tRNA preQ1(34) S-adenosylmethionine ribosyltransferase-isomerase QueA [Paludibacteraceae bacterium]
MKLSQFKFRLPEELIAQYPSPYREDARLMVLHRKSGEIEHKLVRDMVAYFGEGDVFVFNDTKVFPARLYAKKEKTMANIEIFLLRELNHNLRYWDVLVDPARKIRIGNKLFLDEDTTIVGEVIDNTTSRGRTIRFLTDYDNSEFKQYLYSLGNMPLPKYIRRPMEEDTKVEFEKVFPDMTVDELDEERYQTVFADKIGAVAAPAAGLHFSKQLLKRLEIVGAEIEFVTSHMSLGNFRAIDVEDLTKHKMESEQFMIPQKTADAITKAHSNQTRVCAVGTEVMRAMEHVAGIDGQIKPYDGWTNKFIFPPYDFTVANAFFVNFYFPQSPQLLMVAAFGGFENTMRAYNEAVEQGYRFGDYGDAMLIVD